MDCILIKSQSVERIVLVMLMHLCSCVTFFQTNFNITNMYRLVLSLWLY